MGKRTEAGSGLCAGGTKRDGEGGGNKKLDLAGYLRLRFSLAPSLRLRGHLAILVFKYPFRYKISL